MVQVIPKAMSTLTVINCHCDIVKKDEAFSMVLFLAEFVERKSVASCVDGFHF